MTAVPKIEHDNEPIPLASIKKQVPWWPFGTWWTAKLIREGKLPCIRIGRRVFVTKALLQEFADASVVRR